MQKSAASFSQIDKLYLMAVDALCFSIFTLIIYQSHFGKSYIYIFEPLFWISLVVSLAALYIFGGYEFSDRVRFGTLIFRTLTAAVAAVIFISFISFILWPSYGGTLNKTWLLVTILVFFVVSSGPRFLFLYFEKKQRRGMSFLFVADEDARREIILDLRKNKFQGRTKFISEKDLTCKILAEDKWSALVLTSKNNKLDTDTANKLLDLRLEGLTVIHICDFYEVMWNTIPARFLDTSWFLLTEGFSLIKNPIDMRFKRFVDVVLSLLLLSVLWPVMLLTALAVRLESSGGAIYKQQRVGRWGRNFQIYKFRSMVSDAEKIGAQWATENDNRITKVGKVIRATRLDELPQLWNVLKGDMSFIGPRPEREVFNQEIEKFVPFYSTRNYIRPGLTGWAQVLYRYGASIEDSKQKFQYDLYYIKNHSVALDLSIILKTISVVLLGKGR